jgi:hypothetical protein
MTEEARKYAGNTRGRPFQPGNPGKPKGARHRATRAMEALLDGEGEALTRRAIEMALAGDSTAMRLCMDRLLPALRERPVSVDLPPLNGSQDAVAVSAALIAAVALGEIAPGEAHDIGRLFERSNPGDGKSLAEAGGGGRETSTSSAWLVRRGFTGSSRVNFLSQRVFVLSLYGSACEQQAHRSISPNTMSSAPMIAGTSASVWRLHMKSSASRWT